MTINAPASRASMPQATSPKGWIRSAMRWAKPALPPRRSATISPGDERSTDRCHASYAGGPNRLRNGDIRQENAALTIVAAYVYREGLRAEAVSIDMPPPAMKGSDFIWIG